MENEHKYKVSAWWSSGKSGLAKSESAPSAIHFTAPPEFGGLQGRWTPEDLLLGALASCYTTTFRALADYCNLEYSDLCVEVEGAVVKTESGYAFREMIIRPTLSISAESVRRRALRVLQKTKAMCLVSRALDVEQKFEPQLHVDGSRAAVDRPVPVA